MPLLVSRQSMFKDDLGNWLHRDVEALNILATYNLVYNTSLMVEEGMGYALALDKLINTGGKSTLCFRPLAPKLEVELDIVWKNIRFFPRQPICFWS